MARDVIRANIIRGTMKPLHFFAAALLIVAVAVSAHAQTMSYGPSITLEMAKKAAAPAIAEARKNNWTMAIAIVDTAGDLVYFEKMDDTQVGSVEVAQAKARSAARFKRPTKAFQDALAAGGEGLRILALDGAIPVDGGLPVVVGGRIVGAIGASGGTSAQDGQVAAAGVAALR
jgi:glc operon protein GlcG